MTTKIILLASLLFATALAGPAAAGPDFASKTHGPAKLAEDVAFAFNSNALLSTSHSQIESVAHWLKRNPTKNIVLEGHADSTGAAVYNQDLAARRADMVRMHLIGHGISSDRILVIVFGEAKAKRMQSPIDRRVVLHATSERLETAAQRILKRDRALHASWTKKGVLFTETHGVRPGALARR